MAAGKTDQRRLLRACRLFHAPHARTPVAAVHLMLNCPGVTVLRAGPAQRRVPATLESAVLLYGAAISSLTRAMQ